MKLLKMYNLCVSELAPMRFPAHSPQAIVKLEPLARSVANINLSSLAYQYLITDRVSLPHAFKDCSFMGSAVCKALETYICIRKMIIGKVHHLLRFLTISLSYSRLSRFFLLPSRDLKRFGCFLLKDTRLFTTTISEVSLSLRACRFSCLGQELRGRDGHSVGEVLIYEHLAECTFI